MPIPKPNTGEKQDEFIERCMGNDIMKEDFPDNKQRLAVCFKQWRGEDSLDIEIERRNVSLTEFRLSEEKQPKIIGHAAMFNQLSEPLFDFREKIAPGAFKKSLKQDDIRALFNHDANYPLGRNKSGTLKLKEDNEGLYIEIDPPNTTWAKDLQESIRRGDISQMSFGFTVVKDNWEHIQGKESIRTLQEVKLYDVSPVTFPAYPQTTVMVRDYISALKKQDEKGTLKPSESNLEKLRLNYGYKK
jgi:HK97 family phage prohead protease